MNPGRRGKAAHVAGGGRRDAGTSPTAEATQVGVLCPPPQKGIFQKIGGWNSQRDDPDWQSDNDYISL
jgi:hypothetical protein